MPKRPSIKTKILRGQGQGVGASYKAFVTANEFNSLGTAVMIPDYKTGRIVYCLSQGEMLWYYLLRWDDDNIDIREQFPLWDEDRTSKPTKRIAEQLHVQHPQGIMTTDFLVTKADDSLHAYSVKPNRSLSDRAMQKLCIEKLYWEARGVPFTMLFREDVNLTFATNIRLVTEFYDPRKVHDEWSAVKHKIATKEYVIDMEHEVINTTTLKKILKGESYE